MDFFQTSTVINSLKALNCLTQQYRTCEPGIFKNAILGGIPAAFLDLSNWNTNERLGRDVRRWWNLKRFVDLSLECLKNLEGWVKIHWKFDA
jgi:hypothetical protein